MAEINLGDFPFYGGVAVEDISIYIGNNRFFRFVSQRDNNSTIGVIYETNDVFDNNSTINQVLSEVLFDGVAHYSTSMVLLGNGKVGVITRTYPTTAYYAFTVEYDGINNSFITSDLIYLNNSYLNSSSSSFASIQPYGQEDAFVIATDNSVDSTLIRISFGTTISATNIRNFSSSTYYDQPYGYAASQSIQIVDDRVYFRNTAYSFGLEYIYDINTDTIDSSAYNSYPSICKLAENKYVVIRYVNNSAELEYELYDSLPNRINIVNGSYSQLIPNVLSVGIIQNDTGRILETFQLDDQHLIIFDKAGNSNNTEDDNIYARVVKIVDGNYAYVSENSNTGNGVLITSNYNGTYTTMSQFYNGKLIHRVDNQRFYIQTNKNSFEFFTLTV